MVLCSLTLAGNPICAAASYRGAVLAQLRHLKFLDHQRVSPAEVAAAIELHQVTVQIAMQSAMQSSI